MLEREESAGRSQKIVKIGGYLVAGGALAGFSAGAYLLFNRDAYSFLNRELFSYLIRIAQFEVMSYFLGVVIPSFAVLILLGYLFATTLRLKKAEFSNMVPLVVLSILCIVLSALSFLFVISFLGGLLILLGLIRSYTNATFKSLSKREAFFLVEIGPLFVISFVVLFLVMWLFSNVFQTYGLGFYVNYSPYPLLLVGFLSFFMFFAIPLWGGRGTNAGLCGALGLVLSILSYLFVVRNQYGLFSASAYMGISMLIFGVVSALFGELLFLRLFFFEPYTPASAIISSELLYHGGYCPYCGKPRLSVSQKSCSVCGRNLMWAPYAPFCSSCGRLVPANVQTCPHCKEDIRNKWAFFQMQDATEEAIASRIVKSGGKPSWIVQWFRALGVIFSPVRNAVSRVTRFVNGVINRLSLTLKELAIIIILSYVFGFVCFVGYVNTETTWVAVRYLIAVSYGLPLPWLKVYWWSKPWPYIYHVDVLWFFLIVDALLYFFTALGLVYGIVRWRRG